MSLHLKLLDIDHPLTFEESKFRQIEAHALIYLRMFDISGRGYVYTDDKTTMRCSKRFKLLNATHIIYTEEKSVSCRINVTVLKYSCVSCPPGYYSLQKGTSRGLFVNSTVECLQCPFGASCIERNIAAKPNFWGYQATNSRQQQLQFSPCPEHYCKSPSQDSKESRENDESVTVVVGKEMVLSVESAPRDSQNLCFQPNALKLQNATVIGFGL